MQNARQLADEERIPTFLLCGLPGTGKSAQAWSLPGKKFGYVFDQNTLQTWRGLDIDYEVFLPDLSDVNISATVLSSKRPSDRPVRKKEPLAYRNWETDFETKDDKRFFSTYNWIVFDSFTGFLDILMDRILYLNGRLGKQPEQSDWAAQVNTVTNVMKTIAAYDVGVLATAHIDFKQNDTSKKLFWHLYVTGKLRIRLPQIFNNIFVCHNDTDDKGNRVFEFQTVADKEYPTVRTQWGDLHKYEDASIRSWETPTRYGLGRILKEHGYGGALRSGQQEKKVVSISSKIRK